jgi:hypothetical protein
MCAPQFRDDPVFPIPHNSGTPMTGQNFPIAIVRCCEPDFPPNCHCPTLMEKYPQLLLSDIDGPGVVAA